MSGWSRWYAATIKETGRRVYVSVNGDSVRYTSGERFDCRVCSLERAKRRFATERDGDGRPVAVEGQERLERIVSETYGG